MAITADDLGVDKDLALRVLGYARPVAPCLQTLADGDRDTAIAILKSVATRVQQSPGAARVRTAGDWSVTYFSDAELGGFFGTDDRAALRALCGAAVSGRGPVGHFPPPMDYSRVFR